MPGRASLGSAEYDITVNNQQFLTALAQAEAKSKEAAAQVAAAVRQQQQAYAFFGNQVPAEVQKVIAAQQQAATAAKQAAAEAQAAVRAQAAAVKAASDQEVAAINRTKQARQQASAGAAAGGLGGVGGALAVGAGAAGIGLGAAGAVAGFKAVVEAAGDAERAEFSVRKTFGDGAEAINKWADDMADATGQSDEAIKRAFVSTRLYTQELGLTDKQAEQLVERASDLAAVYGGDLQTALSALEGVLRGNTRAGAQYGITLKGMTDAELEHLRELGPLETAQALFAKAMDETNDKMGASGELADTATGAFRKLQRSIDELAEAVGKSVVPDLAEMAKSLADVFNAMQALQNVQLPDWLRDLMRGRPAGAPSLFETIFGRKFGEAGADTIVGPGGSLIDTDKFTAPKPAAETADQGPLFGPGPADVAAANRAQEELERVTKDALNAQIDDQRDAKDREKEFLQERKKAAQDLYESQKQSAEDARDAEIQASQATAEATVRDLDRRKQAASDYYADQIKQAERSRDAELAAVDARRDAAIRSIEEEQRGVERARVAEDRATADAREAEQRSIGQSGAAFQRFIDDQIRGIEEARDADLKAVDERAAAEDRRHREALRNIDEEADRQLGIIDIQLKALDAREEKERRAETDRSLKDALSQAKGDVRSAKTPAERARAQRELQRAEDAIAKERRQRERDDQRATLRAQADAIKKEADQRKNAENQRAEGAKAGFEAEKERIKDTADAEIAGLKLQEDAFKASQAARLEAARERYKAEDRLREDQRKAEDQAFDDRKKKIQDDAEAEKRAIKETYDARIEAIRQQAQASDRYYDDEKRKVQDAARAQQAAIKATADAHIRALAAQRDATILELDRQGKEWEKLRDRIIAALRAALKDIRGYLSGTIKVTYEQGGVSSASVPSPATGGTGSQNLGLFEGGAGALDRTPGSPTFGQRINLPQVGSSPTGAVGISDEEVRRITRRAAGGPMDAYRAYIVGERGPELVIPRNASTVIPEPMLASSWSGGGRRTRPATGRAAMNFSPTINVDGRGVPNVERLADLVVARTVDLLDRAERLAADPVADTQGLAL